MEIKSTHTNRKGQISQVVYRDIENMNELEGRKAEGLRAFCFYKDKLIIVHEKEGHWNLPGGGAWEGETIEETVSREVKEETNMNVLTQHCLGYVDAFYPEGTKSYTFSVCEVEPFGDFASDPGEEVTEILEIDPHELKNYDHHFDSIKEHLLARAIEFKNKTYGK